MTSNRSIVRGTTEYIDITVSSNDAITLNVQPVDFSFDKVTWLEAEWTGTAATTRTARLLLTPDTTPPNRSNPIYVRITDSPEIPALRAGSLLVED